MHESEKWKGNRSVGSDPQRPHGLQPTRLLCPWDFPGKSTGVGFHYLLQKHKRQAQMVARTLSLQNPNSKIFQAVAALHWKKNRILTCACKKKKTHRLYLLLTFYNLILDTERKSRVVPEREHEMGRWQDGCSSEWEPWGQVAVSAPPMEEEEEAATLNHERLLTVGHITELLTQPKRSTGFSSWWWQQWGHIQGARRRKLSIFFNQE